jgi:hypothetical protein
MSWRGQGGKRAKGRRGDQDPELDNTAWLAELEREAAQAGDDEDDWASTLRSRRAAGTPPPAVPPAPAGPPAPGPPPAGSWPPGGVQPPAGSRPSAGPSAAGPSPAAPEPGWASPPAATPSPPPDDRRFGADTGSGGRDPWSADPSPQDPPPPDPDWSTWRPPAPDAFPEPEGSGADWARSREPADDQGWRSASADTPTGTWSPEPVGREPDYPALFGELYRRSSSQQDPIWEAPPAPEPLPDHGQPDPPSGSWPYEETTQSWEPSDRSFIWPSDELPSTQSEWEPVPLLDGRPRPTPRSRRSASRPQRAAARPTRPASWSR